MLFFPPQSRLSGWGWRKSWRWGLKSMMWCNFGQSWCWFCGTRPPPIDWRGRPATITPDWLPQGSKKLREISTICTSVLFEMFWIFLKEIKIASVVTSLTHLLPKVIQSFTHSVSLKREQWKAQLLQYSSNIVVLIGGGGGFNDSSQKPFCFSHKPPFTCRRSQSGIIAPNKAIEFN